MTMYGQAVSAHYHNRAPPSHDASNDVVPRTNDGGGGIM